MTVNKVILVGNLGADPDVRTMNSGDEVANLSVATSQKWKDKNTGEKKEKTEWHRVLVFKKGLVGAIKQYLTKGSKVYIEGSLQTRKWTDNNGVDKYSTEVVVNGYNHSLNFLDSKGSGGGDRPASAPAPDGAPGDMSDLDDEIPF